jgi:hypothetical protein
LESVLIRIRWRTAASSSRYQWNCSKIPEHLADDSIKPWKEGRYRVIQAQFNSSIDVVEAEKNFGISYFRDYHSIEIKRGQCCILFTARFQHLPDKLHLISCPRLIHAPDLTSDNRELLRTRLDAAADLIPKEEWDKLKRRYDIAKKEWFIVSDK